MPLKRPIRGSGDTGVAEAPEQCVKMETDVAIAVAEVSLDLDVIDGFLLPQPKPMVYTDFGDDSDNHSSDDDGQLFG
ncbi:E3 ubiquitin-protein ligase [Hordeum vulgare]|nr:E3 ubiquitin-protein ligase [Hordeum vulgare]